ncbi:MAG: UMP kinase [Patescibacteria group bacterium]
MVKPEVKVISIGGSIIIPKTGFDIEFLKKFREMIIARVKTGERFILVVGGGSTCRAYQAAAKSVVDLSGVDLDWLGIAATHFNAQFVKLLFGDLAYPQIVDNPTKKIKTNKPIIVAGGWQPGCSTDRDAVLLAKTYGAKEVINASNIDFVYTADPKKDPSAKPIPKMTWPQMQKIVGEMWSPGANLPFDPLATKEAGKLKLKVSFVKGTDLKTFANILNKKEFQGTVVE